MQAQAWTTGCPLGQRLPLLIPPGEGKLGFPALSMAAKLVFPEKSHPQTNFLGGTVRGQKKKQEGHWGEAAQDVAGGIGIRSL